MWVVQESVVLAVVKVIRSSWILQVLLVTIFREGKVMEKTPAQTAMLMKRTALSQKVSLLQMATVMQCDVHPCPCHSLTCLTVSFSDKCLRCVLCCVVGSNNDFFDVVFN